MFLAETIPGLQKVFLADVVLLGEEERDCLFEVVEDVWLFLVGEQHGEEFEGLIDDLFVRRLGWEVVDDLKGEVEDVGQVGTKGVFGHGETG